MKFFNLLRKLEKREDTVISERGMKKKVLLNLLRKDYSMSKRICLEINCNPSRGKCKGGLCDELHVEVNSTDIH